MVMWQMPKAAAEQTEMNASNDWQLPSGGGQAKLESLEVVRKTLGLEQNSISADPQFRFPDTYEWDYETNGPAARLRAGHDFHVTDSQMAPAR